MDGPDDLYASCIIINHSNQYFFICKCRLLFLQPRAGERTRPRRHVTFRIYCLECENLKKEERSWDNERKTPRKPPPSLWASSPEA